MVGNGNAAVYESDCWGQHLEGDWAALDLPLRIPEERVVLRHKVKKERKKGTALTKPLAVALMRMHLKGLVKFRGGGEYVLFKRTHPPCMAARRLFLPVVTTSLSECDSWHT